CMLLFHFFCANRRPHSRSKRDWSTDVCSSEPIEVKQLKMKMEKAWEDAQTKLQHAKEEQTTATSNVDHANKQLMETKEKRKKAEQQFIEWLVNSSFSTVDEYRRAKMSTGERQRLKEDIQT